MVTMEHLDQEAIAFHLRSPEAANSEAHGPAARLRGGGGPKQGAKGTRMMGTCWGGKNHRKTMGKTRKMVENQGKIMGTWW